MLNEKFDLKTYNCDASFRIKGRDVHFDKACGGVLNTTFEELCARDNIYIQLLRV